MKMIFKDSKTVVFKSKNAEALDRFFHMFDGRQRVVDLFMFGDGKHSTLRLTFGRPHKTFKR